MNYSFSFLFLAGRCGPLQLYLIYFKVSCAFTDAVLHILVVMGENLSYFSFLLVQNRLLVSSNLWDQWDIFTQWTDTCWPTFLFQTILCKPWWSFCWKSQDRPTCHELPYQIKSHLNNVFLPYFDALFELRQIIFNMSTCLNTLSCDCVIIYIKEQLQRHL